MMACGFFFRLKYQPGTWRWPQFDAISANLPSSAGSRIGSSGDVRGRLLRAPVVVTMTTGTPARMLVSEARPLRDTP